MWVCQDLCPLQLLQPACRLDSRLPTAGRVFLLQGLAEQLASDRQEQGSSSIRRAMACNMPPCNRARYNLQFRQTCPAWCGRATGRNEAATADVLCLTLRHLNQDALVEKRVLACGAIKIARVQNLSSPQTAPADISIQTLFEGNRLQWLAAVGSRQRNALVDWLVVLVIDLRSDVQHAACPKKADPFTS